MVCTQCGQKTDIINSRPQKHANTVWRRRRCKACQIVFSTREQADYAKTWVVQYSDGGSQPFLRDKLMVSLYNALRHRGPTALQDAVALSETVINKIRLQKKPASKINNTIIAEAAYATLKRFDKPAAISYQAFHTDVL